MAAEGQEYIYLNRPEAREYRVEYQPPPAPSNPVLRGLPLYYLAQLVVNSGLVQSVLWSLNGFGKLRNHPALEDVDPRYVPTVIRAPKDLGVAKALREGEYLAALNAADWSAKAPPSSSGRERKVLRSCLEYYEAYQSGELTPVDVVEALLPLVRRGGKGEEGKHATAFLCVRAEMVRKAAEESAERWRRGKPWSVIDGVVMAVKDEEDLAGHTRSLGSTLDFARADDATSFCVQKWLDAGAICLGKTNMHEMGLDITNNNPTHGTPRNPYHPGYYCGGSSGGSAYAVAAGLVPFAMGNDGGGSIRIPASFCGLFGLKTTHGRVSARPTANLARSTGVAGPLAANMVDLEVAYRVMAEPDEEDGESGMFASPLPVKGEGKGRKALGVFRPWFDRAEREVREVCWRAIEWLERERGYEVVDIDIPMVHEGQTTHALTIMTEILSGCDPATLAALTPPNKILLAVASQTSSRDFLQAQKLRNLLMQHLAWLFERERRERGRELVIITPTTPNPGIPNTALNANAYGVSDGNTQLRTMQYAYLANFTGNPALTLPAGYLAPLSSPSSSADAGGEGRVPVGLMGMADWGGEETLLEFGYDGEEYLHAGLEGGRREAGEERGVDVLGLARELRAKGGR